MLALGVDLGGTKIEAALVDVREDALNVITRQRVPTESAEGYDAILHRTSDLVTTIAATATVDLRTLAVGVGMPGNVERRSGVVKNSNTVCLNGRPFRADLERELGRKIAFENDANCFALAEARFGAARAHAKGVVFGVILGTGVGGGLVVRGEAWSGPQGIAGEWGHHAIRPTSSDSCYCGKRGCLELYASGPAVERDYARRSGRTLDLADIARARGSDRDADAAIEGLVDAFGRGLANVIAILDPSAIVLGGGVSNLDLLYDEGVARIARYVFNDELTTPVLRNALGDSAGVLGAALLPAP